MLLKGISYGTNVKIEKVGNGDGVIGLKLDVVCHVEEQEQLDTVVDRSHKRGKHK